MKIIKSKIAFIILSFLIVLLIVFSTNIQNLKAQQLTTNNGLIADWKLNEGSSTTAIDSSGNGYNGTIYGASWVSNQGSYALSFDGVSSSVAVPSLPISNVNALTVVAWIKSNLTQYGYIFYNGNSGEFLLHNGQRASDGPVNGSYPNLASFSVKTGSGWLDSYSNPMMPNVWHQIVGVWVNGVSLKVYVDGLLAGENDSIPSGGLNNAGPSALGAYSQGTQGFFKGQMNNVMLYSFALSPEEIQTLYSNPLASIPSPSPSPIPTTTQTTISIATPTISPNPTITPIVSPTNTPQGTTQPSISPQITNITSVKTNSFNLFSTSGLIIVLLIATICSVTAVFFYKKNSSKTNRAKITALVENKENIALMEASEATKISLSRIKQMLPYITDGFFVDNDTVYVNQPKMASSLKSIGKFNFDDISKKFNISNQGAKDTVVNLQRIGKLKGYFTLNGESFITEDKLLDEVRKKLA